MHIPLIVGGAGGIGLALAHLLAERHEVERVYIVDRNEVPAAQQHPKFTTFRTISIFSDVSPTSTLCSSLPALDVCRLSAT